MSHYHDSDDLKVLGEFKKLAPAEFKGFVELDSIVGRDDGKIPRKYRELIALAVACTTQCPYCLDVHTRNAKKAGATREEVAESALLAAALRAGAAVTHGARSSCSTGPRGIDATTYPELRHYRDLPSGPERRNWGMERPRPSSRPGTCLAA